MNAHSLFSKWFSESGKLVSKLFGAITELVEEPQSLVFVLIDEVESLTAARKVGVGGVDQLGVAGRPAGWLGGSRRVLCGIVAGMCVALASWLHPRWFGVYNTRACWLACLRVPSVVLAGSRWWW